MKGPMGLVVAAALGVFAAVLNWLYLQQKAGDFETVSLLGVADGVVIQPGELLRREHFAEVRVPKQKVGELPDFVYLWKDLNTMVGVPATRRYEGGDLVFRQDYRTPPPELKLAEDERLIWIPVDSRSFVPDLVDPGDLITFILPPPGLAGPTPAGAEQGGGRAASRGADMFFGPFRVGSLGSRLGSADVAKAARVAQAQERQVGIIVKWEKDRLEAEAMRLLERLQRSDYRNISVALHPKPERAP